MGRSKAVADLSDRAVGGATISVRVTPGASRVGVDVAEGEIHIRVNAQPEGGRATEAARALLAEALGVAKTRLTLVRGATSRNKLFRLD
jgi:uncharacterized protein